MSYQKPHDCLVVVYSTVTACSIGVSASRNLGLFIDTNCATRYEGPKWCRNSVFASVDNYLTYYSVVIHNLFSPNGKCSATYRPPANTVVCLHAAQLCPHMHRSITEFSTEANGFWSKASIWKFAILQSTHDKNLTPQFMLLLVSEQHVSIPD